MQGSILSTPHKPLHDMSSGVCDPPASIRIERPIRVRTRPRLGCDGPCPHEPCIASPPVPPAGSGTHKQCHTDQDPASAVELWFRRFVRHTAPNRTCDQATGEFKGGPIPPCRLPPFPLLLPSPSPAEFPAAPLPCYTLRHHSLSCCGVWGPVVKGSSSGGSAIGSLDRPESSRTSVLRRGELLA